MSVHRNSSEGQPLLSEPSQSEISHDERLQAVSASIRADHLLSTLPFYEEDIDDEDEIVNRNFTVSGHHIDEGHQEMTSIETLMHLIKGNIGTGILAMPDALRNSGLYTGLVLLPMLAAICIHCMHILVKCSNELKRRTSLSSLDYSDVAEHAIATGPLKFRSMSTTARKVVNVFLVLTQMGFCCVYVVFIAANLKQVIDCQYPNIGLDIHGYMGMILVPLLAFSMIRSLKVLAPFSMISNVLLILGLTICFYYVFDDLPSSYNRKEFSSWKQLPLFFGTSIYAFEGIGVVLPLERRMKNPQQFRGWNGVLSTAMNLVTCGYIAVGFYGYLKYGDAVKGSITLNLPAQEQLAQLVKILMAVAIFFTYGLMLYVPVQIIWPSIKGTFVSRKSRRLGEYGFRALLVLISFSLAAIIPDIGLFISLVGAISSSTLAIIFPPLLQMITFHETMTRTTRIKCYLIIMFGLLCFATGSYASIHAIVKYFTEPNLPHLAAEC